MATTIMLYLEETIKFTLMQNPFISIMNSNFCRRVSCDLIQCGNHTRMYTLNLIQNVSSLIHFTSNMTPVQLFSHSSHYLSFLLIYFYFSTSGIDIISTRGGIHTNKGVSTVLLHGKRTTEYFLISEFYDEINLKGYTLRLMVE